MTRFDLLLANARVVTPAGRLDDGWIGVTDGKIAAIGSGSCSASAEDRRDLDGAWLGPGFIDVHIHGSIGIDTMDADEEDLRTLSRFLVGHGVTSYLAATSTAAPSRIRDALGVIARVGERVPGGASILGAYLEGPFLNPARRGAAREQWLRPIDRGEVAGYLRTGVVRAMTLAPELAGARRLIRDLAGAGVTVAAGHTDATYEQMVGAARNGVSSVTHTFNGMRGLHHREPGAAGAALLLDDLVCELIADGIHVAPELMTLFWRMKGPQRIALVTDASPYGGMPDGVYKGFDRTVTIAGGVGRLPDGTIAGSAKTFEEGFVRLCRNAGVPLDEAWPTVSEVPARIAGVADRKGTIERGKDADAVVLDNDGRVLAAIVGGYWIEGSSGARPADH